MQIVIDIPEESYKLICSDGRPFLPSYKWIKNGIPLDDVLDKIRAEIEKPLREERYFDTADAKAQYIALNWCIDIIDKYKVESEE